MNSKVLKVGLLLSASGFCALVYQSMWLRELRLVFGASTPASAAVLAIFMGGLGLGGALLGKKADQSKNPLELYAKLELVVALTAALSPLLIWLVRLAYVSVGGTQTLGIWGGTALRLLLSTLVLALPTLAMGGTLPAAARAIETEEDLRRRGLAVLYGLNTLGAVAGVVLSTFFMVEAWGTRNTLWVAAVLNVAVALVALAVSKRLVPSASPSKKEAKAAPLAAAASPLPARFVYAAAAIVGFVFLLMELVWYRMLSPILGGSTFTFGLILAVALSGIALGGAAYALLGSSRPATVRGFALTCGLEALAVAFPFWLGDALPVWAVVLRQFQVYGFAGLASSWAVIALVVVFPAAFISGVQFPILIGLLGQGREGVGEHAGNAYAWNTAGSIVGSLAGGFGLMPLLTAPGVWRVVVVCLAVTAAASVLLAARGKDKKLQLLAPSLAAAVAVLLVLGQGPTGVWRHSPVGAGRIKMDGSRNNLVAGLRSHLAETKWEAEGLETAVALQTKDAYAFVLNGKIDGNALNDSGMQVMGGVLPAILHPNPKRALVVGLGTGSTAGWLATLPSIEQVDVVEIEPAILEVARRCAPVNENVLNNPKVKVIIADAREVLLTAGGKYDVIFSEPSNPYRAGIASLFTQEFYAAVKERLADGGLFAQWLQAYEVDALTVQQVYATLSSQFPSVETWEPGSGDLLLVASNAQLLNDVPTLRAKLEEPAYRKALTQVWGTIGLEGMLAHFVAGPELARQAALVPGVELNTDQRPLVEFAFARSVGSKNGFATDQLRVLARRLGVHRRALSGGEVDWLRVETEAAVGPTFTFGDPNESAAVEEEAVRRAQLLTSGNSAAVVQGYKNAAWRPYSRIEWVPLGLAHAMEADEMTELFIQQLSTVSQLDSKAVAAIYRLRKGETERAVALLEEVLLLHRTDPWLSMQLRRVVIDAAAQVGRGEPAYAERMYAALKEPFAVYSGENDRVGAILTIVAGMPNGAAACAREFESREPNAVWSEPVLALRVRCYEHTGHPLTALAKQELEQFRAWSSPEFQLQGLEPMSAGAQTP